MSESEHNVGYPGLLPIRVALALPTYDGTRHNAMGMVDAAINTDHVTFIEAYGSLLAHVFNRTLIAALGAMESQKLTHFVMMHSDIVPEDGWIRKLYEAHQSVGGSGIISVVSPIKGTAHDMATSTAMETEDIFAPRKLTLEECYKLPRVFTRADAGKIGLPVTDLLVNTGLMMFRLDEPWVRNITFQVSDAIVNGVAVTEPEDWALSRQVNDMGVPVYATTAVKLRHMGRAGWSNWMGGERIE